MLPEEAGYALNRGIVLNVTAMPSRYVVRRARRSYLAQFNRGHLCHAVPLLDPRDILHAGDTAQALCGLMPRRGWDTRPMPDVATIETVTCPLCRKRLLAKESGE